MKTYFKDGKKLENSKLHDGVCKEVCPEKLPDHREACRDCMILCNQIYSLAKKESGNEVRETIQQATVQPTN